MSKGHVAAALLSVPKEAEATERAVSRAPRGVFEGAFTIFFFYSFCGGVSFSRDHGFISAGRETRESDFFSRGNGFSRGAFGELRFEKGR